MNKKRIFLSILMLWLAVVSCNWPSASGAISTAETADLTSDQLTEAAPISAGQPTATLTATVTPTTQVVQPATATSCTPTVVANSPVNVRSGPGTVYDIIGALVQGGSATVEGKNNEGTWWYIAFPGVSGGHGWVAVSVTTSSCIAPSVAIIAAPPTPVPPSGTCKDNYVWRLIKPSDKVCVPPASKAQADADNAAAASRLVTATYGPDTCAQGYVWREAFSGDHVCVTPAVKSQAAADNAAASSRWVSSADHTCVFGYVWREATGNTSDDVCVTVDVRTQAAADNAAAASRLATAAYGPDTCAQGYVWREAFSGDHVCVTPAVKSQVAADNAAAASHTWP